MMMFSDIIKNISCSKCKMKSEMPGVELPVLVFTFLEGSPALCEKCMAEALGLFNPKWAFGLKLEKE